MIRVMFVCHGNICRSPMAEFIMKKLVADAGLSDEFEISSCAVSYEEVGNGIYPPAREELKKHNIPFSDHRARRVEENEYDLYDLFIVMDRSNVRLLKGIFGADSDKKIHMLLEYTGQQRDVSDPWYSRRFDVAFNDIYSGCQALLKNIINGT